MKYVLLAVSLILFFLTTPSFSTPVSAQSCPSGQTYYSCWDVVCPNGQRAPGGSCYPDNYSGNCINNCPNYVPPPTPTPNPQGFTGYQCTGSCPGSYNCVYYVNNVAQYNAWCGGCGCAQPTATPTPTPAIAPQCLAQNQTSWRGGTCINCNYYQGSTFMYDGYCGGCYACATPTPTPPSCASLGGKCCDANGQNCDGGAACTGWQPSATGCNPNGIQAYCFTGCTTAFNNLYTCNASGTGYTCTSGTPVNSCVTTPDCTTNPVCSNTDCTGAAPNTCSLDNGTQSGCVFTGPGTCRQVAAPNQPCQQFNCNPGYECQGGNCIQPTFNLSGNVFLDNNKNQIKDGSESNYGSTVSMRAIHTGTGATTTFSGTGSYSTALTTGTYRIEFTNFPGGYNMTYPLNGPPPSFTITLGNSCSTGSSNSAACDGSGNISNLNFGMTNSVPWIQCVGGSCRRDNGYINPIPGSASAACGGPNAAIARGSSNTPGVLYSGDASYSFGQGQASPNPYVWVVGGLTYSELFSPVNSGIIRTSFDYYTTTARQSGLTITDLTNTHCGAGGLSNCQLSPTLANGIYRANGNLTLTSAIGPTGTYTFPSNRQFVILVNGNLTIQTNIKVPTGSTATFSVNGDIRVDRNVGESTITSYNTNIEGYYSADRSFIIEGINSCLSGADKRFNLGGSVVVNAGQTGGSYQNNRDLCDGNLQCPSNALIERVDFLLNAPQFIKSPTFIWQEVAP